MAADWLLKTALSAIATARPELKNWSEDQLKREARRDRLGALRFICNTLDHKNRQIVADQLGIHVDDLEAAGRVLRSI